MGSIQLQAEDLERRVREYKNDPFIKGCLKRIEELVLLAKPFILINPDNIEHLISDIDGTSKERIAWWQQRIEEYTKTNYPDFFRN